MGLKAFTIDFTRFSQNTLIRSNYKTAVLGIEIKKYIQKSEFKFVCLKEYFDIISGFAFKSADYEREGIPLIRIKNIGNDFDKEDTAFLPEDYNQKYSRFLLKKNDIIISLTGDGKLKSNVILKDNRYLLNQRVGSLRAKKSINIYFFYYIINYYFFTNKQFYWWSTGKTQLNISPFDVLKIKVPLISKSKQDQIVTQIKPIEHKIKELKSQIKTPQNIINLVFAKEFNFDLEKFEELKKIKSYYYNFFAFALANNKDLRNSVKFHRDAGVFINQQLKNITNKKIKHFISEPIVLGKGVSPKDYNENGDYAYISMASIKKWSCEREESKLVSKEYSGQNQNKQIATNDILIARSGEGTIGKVALIEDKDLPGIFADFTMRIRLKNYNHLFAYYYFRTEYFQYLIEINKKGLGNNTNIFPSQIQEFPMIDISLEDQQKIVNEIKVELEKQEEIKIQIEGERDKIDALIKKEIN